MCKTTTTLRILGGALAATSLTFVLSTAPLTAAAAEQGGSPTADLPPPPPSAAPAESAESAEFASSRAAVALQFVSQWSTYTSEEYPPLTASNGQLISAMFCGGAYCDNIYLGYENVGVNYTWNSWTTYFSEEGTYWRTCDGSNSFMTGISCQGDYCDNVSLQCTVVSGKTKTGYCYWTPYFSEEAGYSYLPDGYYAAGLACSGSNCDDLSILACQTF